MVHQNIQPVNHCRHRQLLLALHNTLNWLQHIYQLHMIKAITHKHLAMVIAIIIHQFRHMVHITVQTLKVKKNFFLSNNLDFFFKSKNKYVDSPVRCVIHLNFRGEKNIKREFIIVCFFFLYFHCMSINQTIT